MIIGVDDSGRVLLILREGFKENMPIDFNGTKIAAFELTKEQMVAYLALPADRPGTIFDGYTFTPIPPAAADIKMRLEAAVQRHLDAAAVARGYDSILCASSYATSSHPVFGPEGRAFLDWRDSAWSYVEEQLAKQALPTEAALLAALPLPTLP